MGQVNALAAERDTNRSKNVCVFERLANEVPSCARDVGVLENHAIQVAALNWPLHSTYLFTKYHLNG